MDLYKEYIQEREGLALYTNDHGFVSYRCTGDECYIADIFVKKESRGTSAGFDLIKELGKIAIINGCSHISGVLRTNDPGITRTMKAALKLGFNILTIQNSGVVVMRELKGDMWAE